MGKIYKKKKQVNCFYFSPYIKRIIIGIFLYKHTVTRLVRVLLFTSLKKLRQDKAL